MLYAKVQTKTARTTWFGMSRKNVRSSLTENWLEAICSETTVSEKTMPVVVIMVADTTVKICRASSAVPWKTSLSTPEPGMTRMVDSAAPAAIPSTIPRVGRTHTAPCRYSRTTLRRLSRPRRTTR